MMTSSSSTARQLATFGCLSMAAHLCLLLSVGRFGHYHFAAPVDRFQAVVVEMARPLPAPPAVAPPLSGPDPVLNEPELSGASHPPTPVAEPTNGGSAAMAAPPGQLGTLPAQAPKGAVGVSAAPAPPAASSTQFTPPPPLRTSDEFLPFRREKLTFLVSLLGLPVGSMELEAKNEGGEVRLALTTLTNGAAAGLYPVHDTIETRHIAGNYIITTIKQHEGSFTSDIGFTLFLKDRRVFWVDRLRKRYANETVPTSQVLDTLSSLYYLRNRPLTVGATEMLPVYDGDAYAEVPVAVVRREQIRLRNLTAVDCLVVHHARQNGIFRRTGDMTIWLTNDEYRVPVRVEADTPLGKATVELVSSEAQRAEPAGTP